MLERDQVPPELGLLYDALLQQRGVVPNMFKTVANTPALALGFASLLKPLLSDGALPGWYKELVATRMSVLQGSLYAVTAHSALGPAKGSERKSKSSPSSLISKAGRSPTRKNWACVARTGCITLRIRLMMRFSPS